MWGTKRCICEILTRRLPNCVGYTMFLYLFASFPNYSHTLKSEFPIKSYRHLKFLKTIHQCFRAITSMTHQCFILWLIPIVMYWYIIAKTLMTRSYVLSTLVLKNIPYLKCMYTKPGMADRQCMCATPMNSAYVSDNFWIFFPENW